MKHQKYACRSLEAQATAFLYRRGFRADGRSVKERVPGGQGAFERLLITTPSGGSGGYRLSRRRR